LSQLQFLIEVVSDCKLLRLLYSLLFTIQGSHRL
jgi:hypothetical protein